MAIEDLNSKAELFRAVRENLESEPLPSSAVDGLQQGLQGGNWVAPTLINGWANLGGGHSPAGYRTEPGGTIRLRGTVAGGTAGSVVFVLPPQARPKEKLILLGWDDSGATRIDVGVGGEVFYQGGLETVAVLSLSAVNFAVGS